MSEPAIPDDLLDLEREARDLFRSFVRPGNTWQEADMERAMIRLTREAAAKALEWAMSEQIDFDTRPAFRLRVGQTIASLRAEGKVTG